MAEETELKTLNPCPSSKDTRPLLLSATSSSATSEKPPPSISDLEKKFPPYVRSDTYGTNGLGPIPISEKALLGLALVTLFPIRVVLAVAIVFIYYCVCRVCTAFSVPNREVEEREGEGGGGQEDYAHLGGWRRAVMVASGRVLARAMLFAFGFYWIDEAYRIVENESKEECEEIERPGAIVSNHVSYLDILYHMSSSFPSFVAKRSVGKLPLVGLISKCLGCVYVQREAKSSDFKGVAGVVSERIREAHQSEFAPMMMLFPEGTTTNGDYLLPFKTGAFLPKAPVLPVILRYPYQRFSPAWDTISGVRHIIFLLCQFANYLEVTRLPLYRPSEQEKDDPKLYADNVRRLMAREGNLTLSDIGLPEKRIYHAALNGNNKLPSVMHQKDE